MSCIHEMDRINSSGFPRTQNDIKGGATVLISRTSLWFNPQTSSVIFKTPSLNVEPHQFLKNLPTVMDQLKPVSTASHDRKKMFVHPALGTCTHVLVSYDAVKKPLQAPSDGPYDSSLRLRRGFSQEINTTCICLASYSYLTFLSAVIDFEGF
ncbi:hypothetical protein AVEN_189827-1 [Araneus ventricosus]|uniref:Uncharacterized protein n=1 Tax=Araneus ventricosus TaxID=182803 RepID=A0A4Y2TQ20_ARAVE|nr:hypothetical protein AVEN_189827-1 [Araneus ventricosus]